MSAGLDTTALLQEAVRLHQAGRLVEARERYAQVLAREPRRFDALHLLGVIHRQQGDPARAAQLIREALDIDPHQARAHSNLGAALQDLGETQNALAAYETALRLDPGHALAWDNRGNTLRRLGRPQEALDSHERALAITPNNPDAWRHRAQALADLGRQRDAVASAEQALALRPAFPDALLVLGNAWQALDRPDAALDAYDRALALDAGRADAWCARGAALKKAGRFADALDSYERALALRPDYMQAELYRAHALRALGRRDAALAGYRRAAGLGADADEVGFALAALGAAPVPDAAPAGYVRNLFDQYAGHFDSHLVDALGYRTPALLGELLGAHLPPASPASRLAAALDLGCGTGLCGPELRPLTAHLAGVDLSQRMLDGAAAGGLYDHLACAEIGAWLEGEKAAWDLIAAADVLVYFGELATLFTQVAGALRPDGWFVFSCEALEDASVAAPADARFAILPSNRYAHALAYIASCAAAAGFTIVATQRDALRREHDADVVGHIVLLRHR